MIHPRASVLMAIGIAVLAPLLAGCGPTATPRAAVPTEPPWFEDVTDQVGLDFVHDAGPIDGTYFMPQIFGSGAVLFDFDNDGRLDIFLLQNAGLNPPPKSPLSSAA